MGEGWVGVMPARSPLATRESRKSGPFVSAGTSLKISLKQKTACWDRVSFFAAPLQRHRHPHPTPPPSRGRAAASAYVTAIERHCTSAISRKPTPSDGHSIASDLATNATGGVQVDAAAGPGDVVVALADGCTVRLSRETMEPAGPQVMAALREILEE
jgi:hypothetical protein